jgi:ferrous iron transport protein A
LIWLYVFVTFLFYNLQLVMRITLICNKNDRINRKIMTLADLKPGESGSIKSIETKSPGVVRLMVLGLVEGVDVRFENSAIGGDPLEVSVYGASISVRREQAQNFKLTGTAACG